MKATYFPFTYVADPLAELLAECFGRFIVYRPAEGIFAGQTQLRKNHAAIDIRVPISDNQTELKNAIKNYLNWAEVHRENTGETAAILKAGLDLIPFFNEQSARKIVADIKGSSIGKAPMHPPDPDLTARTFLYFAQEFDRHNQELIDDLEHQQQQAAELMRQLKMENDPAAVEFQISQVQQPEPFADYMISDRLEAWTRIFCRDPEASGLFVTHSAAVLELLLERAATAVRVMHLASTPSVPATDGERKARRARLMSALARLLEQGPAADLDSTLDLPHGAVSGAAVTLSVYRVPDQSPYEFFARWAGMDWPPAGGPPPRSRYKNTLIALVQASLNR